MRERVSLENRLSGHSAKVAATLVLSLGLFGCVDKDEPSPAETLPTPTAEPSEPQVIPTAPSRSTAESPQPPVEVVPSEEPSPTPSPEPEPTVPIEQPEEPGLPIKPTEPPIEMSPSKDSRAIDCMAKRCIALTFDDGPGPYTEQLLDYLDDYDAKATFFVVGSRVDEYSGVANKIHERGHQIGAHSWDHDDLTNKGPEAIAEDTRQTNQAIFDATGVEVEVMRPPYGATNNSVVTAVDMPQILWSVDTEDWRHHDSDYVANYVKDNASRGDIILMHDIHETSVEAVPEILESLTEDGYEIVTVEALLGDDLGTGRYNQQNLAEG